MSISFRGVDYVYQAHTPFEHQSLTQINLEIPDHAYTAIIGHTGSGKSTLIQHVNGLLKPTHGTVEVSGQLIDANTKNKALVQLRKRVGMVFQFPESQLFAETVLEDVQFGPLNFGLSTDEAKLRAQKALKQVELSPSLWEKSPFELSGGQMRRVAIAGVLATDPEILILDEPTAGLDPIGRREMMALFERLYQNNQLTILLVTHQMDDVANFANQVVVMKDGQLEKVGTPEEVFQDPAWLVTRQLDLPAATKFAMQLKQRGINLNTTPLRIEELVQAIQQQKGESTDA